MVRMHTGANALPAHHSGAPTITTAALLESALADATKLANEAGTLDAGQVSDLGCDIRFALQHIGRAMTRQSRARQALDASRGRHAVSRDLLATLVGAKLMDSDSQPIDVATWLDIDADRAFAMLDMGGTELEVALSELIWCRECDADLIGDHCPQCEVAR